MFLLFQVIQDELSNEDEEDDRQDSQESVDTDLEDAQPEPRRRSYKPSKKSRRASSNRSKSQSSRLLTSKKRKVVEDLSFSEFSGYFEVLDYEARNSVVVTVHGDAYDPEKEILSYEYNDLIASNVSYFSVLAYTIGDPLDSEPKLWLYDLISQ